MWICLSSFVRMPHTHSYHSYSNHTISEAPAEVAVAGVTLSAPCPNSSLHSGKAAGLSSSNVHALACSGPPAACTGPKAIHLPSKVHRSGASINVWPARAAMARPWEAGERTLSKTKTSILQLQVAETLGAD